MNARLVLLLALAIAVPVTSRAQTISSTGVIVDAAAVRIDPTATVPLTTLPRGTDVTVLSVQEGWAQIAFEDLRYGRRVGYIPRAMVKIATSGGGARNNVPATNPARPPVRSVADEFPAATRPSSGATSTRQPAARTVLPVGDAFADATPQPSAAVASPVTTDGVNHTSRSEASRAPVSPKRDMRVTLMIPRGLLKDEGDRAAHKGRAVAADITAAPGGGAAVNGVTAWMGAGIPSLLEASVGKIVRKKDYTALELETTDAKGANTIVTLRFADSVIDPEATLGQLVVEGRPDAPAALTYRNEAYAAVADAVFVNDLRGLPAERKLSILATLQRMAGAPEVSLSEGQLYASFDLSADRRVFDDRSGDAATVVSYVLTETILPQIRDMAKSLTEVPELGGLRVLYRIPHQAGPRAAEKEYRVELIADMSHVLEFARTGTSNGAFIDAATLLVDGHSIRIDTEPIRQSAGR